MTAALLLYPAAAGTAIRLLSCKSVLLTGAALSSLDGGAPHDAAAARSSVSVSVLSSDPSFVCFAGSHEPAAALAVAAVVLYVALLPALTLAWLLQSDSVLRASRRNRAPQCLRSCRSPSRAPSAPPDLAPFLGDSGYRPALWWMRHCDICGLLVLVVLDACWPRPTQLHQVRVSME